MTKRAHTLRLRRKMAACPADDNANTADTECKSERTPVIVPLVPAMKRPRVVLKSTHKVHKMQEDTVPALKNLKTSGDMRSNCLPLVVAIAPPVAWEYVVQVVLS
jgi:hypothetical protein